MKEKDVAEELWKLLDDIDTEDDKCRENDEEFRNRVRKIIAQRTRFIFSDSQKLIWREESQPVKG